MNEPMVSFPRLLAVLVLLLVSGSAWAEHIQTYSFNGSGGAAPDGGLIVDAGGNFYGTTGAGGVANAGVVYEMSSSNGRVAETVLYSFSGGTDGANPVGNLVFDGAGNLYGVTANGGAFNMGTVFELSPTLPGSAWAETVLYSFQGGSSDGAHPVAGVVLDGSGNLYGTTSFGGTVCENGCGTVFELAPPAVQGNPWTESMLHFFQGSDGALPMAPLIFDQAGNLYSTTYLGGVFQVGTVFELLPPTEQGGMWTETILHSFNNKAGNFPQAGLALAPNGALCGTATEGGTGRQGLVFALTPPSNSGGLWNYIVLHNFSGPDGATPVAGVTLGSGNTLYGTTRSGPEGGIAFQITFSHGSWVEATLYSLGGLPMAGVTLYKGALYGTTEVGGFKNDGVVYRLSP
jgi:uncharacterized repeat protein (TIGR03803 family)